MVWPSSPWSQPAMTWPPPSGKENAWPLLSEESKTLPSLNSAPVYWTRIFSPFSTLRPSPLIRRWLLSSVGSAAPGTGVMSAGFLPLSLTCGKSAGGGVTVPLTTASGALLLRMSMTKTRLSLAPIDMLGLPWAPKAAAGGGTTSRREPAFLPTTAWSSAGMRASVPAWKICGLPLSSYEDGMSLPVFQSLPV